VRASTPRLLTTQARTFLFVVTASTRCCSVNPSSMDFTQHLHIVSARQRNALTDLASFRLRMAVAPRVAARAAGACSAMEALVLISGAVSTTVRRTVRQAVSRAPSRCRRSATPLMSLGRLLRGSWAGDFQSPRSMDSVGARVGHLCFTSSAG
jgi:hypothetical protein